MSEVQVRERRHSMSSTKRTGGFILINFFFISEKETLYANTLQRS
jgi:hypothetical protein